MAKKLKKDNVVLVKEDDNKSLRRVRMRYVPIEDVFVKDRVQNFIFYNLYNFIVNLANPKFAGYIKRVIEEKEFPFENPSSKVYMSFEDAIAGVLLKGDMNVQSLSSIIYFIKREREPKRISKKIYRFLIENGVDNIWV